MCHSPIRPERLRLSAQVVDDEPAHVVPNFLQNTLIIPSLFLSPAPQSSEHVSGVTIGSFCRPVSVTLPLMRRRPLLNVPFDGWHAGTLPFGEATSVPGRSPVPFDGTAGSIPKKGVVFRSVSIWLRFLRLMAVDVTGAHRGDLNRLVIFPPSAVATSSAAPM